MLYTSEHYPDPTACAAFHRMERRVAAGSRCCPKRPRVGVWFAAPDAAPHHPQNAPGTPHHTAGTVSPHAIVPDCAASCALCALRGVCPGNAGRFCPQREEL
jgi:hypothetical protein